MRLTLVLTEALAEALRQEACAEVESAGMLLARMVVQGDETRLLARRYVPIPPQHYDLRAADELIVRSEGYVPALSLADQDDALAIWFHTHPGVNSAPTPSIYDQRVDKELAEAVRIRTGKAHYGSLIVSPGAEGQITFTGSLASADDTWPIARLWVVGDRFRLTSAYGSTKVAPAACYDRNVRAFGADIQSALQDLKVGIVGCGGTGSAVAELLVRLGVRDFVLIDPKVLSESNLTRVYGSSDDKVGAAKVDVIRDHIVSTARNATVNAIRGSLTSSRNAAEFSACDVVFGCTDDEAGRLVLSRFSTYLLCPVIDCGVLISSDSTGAIVGIDGRVTVLGPGNACLICRRRIDPALAAAQMLPSQERQLRAAEGYAPALGAVEPAVVTFTSSVASAAVNELLDRMIGFGPHPAPSEMLLRFHEREISTNRMLPKERHYCHPETGKWGSGTSAPFLGLSWPE